MISVFSSFFNNTYLSFSIKDKSKTNNVKRWGHFCDEIWQLFGFEVIINASHF